MTVGVIPSIEEDFTDLEAIPREKWNEKQKSKRKSQKSNKIIPFNQVEIETDTLQKKRKSKVKPKYKKHDILTDRKESNALSLLSSSMQYSLKETLTIIFFSKRSWRLAVWIFTLGLILAIYLEIRQKSFTYNTLLLVFIEASIQFPHFPPSIVRPQMCIAILIIISFVLDITRLYWNYSNDIEVIIVQTLVMLCKIILFYSFLRNAKHASRVRKYLDRRMRLFLIPCSQPKRIMREIRGRLLALGWIHFFAMNAYLCFFFVYLVYFDYGTIQLSPISRDSLSIFLIVKAFTSGLVMYGVIYDSDIRLCLWHFGCLGFAAKYIKKYIAEKVQELKGWPLAFSFYIVRFHILSLVKVLDILFGIYGWILIGSNFGENYLRLNTNLQIFITFLVYQMLITDIWATILFFVIRWLWKRHKIILSLDLNDKSDDSEIEEFNLRSEIISTEKNPLLTVSRSQPKETQKESFVRKSKPVSQFKLKSIRDYQNRSLSIAPVSESIWDDSVNVLDNESSDV